MTKQKRRFTRAVALCLLACLCVSIVGCTQQSAVETESTGQEKVTYTVTVTSQGGQPLEGIGVYIYTDESQSELVWFDRTDAAGAMTFSDVTCDGYVAVLSGVPEGYQTAEQYPITGENTGITLSAVMGELEDPSSVTYKLGDVMNDFTVTAADGTEYTLSELLTRKKAVVLNFWYLECQPCKLEFPYLQEAYEQYGDQIEVLAMNPVNDNADEVAAFRADNGYTFPMMLCDKSWTEALSLEAYPTTVVIDRYGTITMIHKGYITETETFENIFAFFSAEDYQQTIVEDVKELPAAQEETGTPSNPIEIGAMPSFTVSVPAGETVYLNIYRVTTLYMQISDTSAFIEYGGRTYTSSYGRVGVTISSDDTTSAVSVGIGNSSDEDKTYTVTMSALAGSYSNPYTLELGQFDVTVAAGNDQGVYYRYQVPEDGVLTVQCLSATKGIAYDFNLYNLSSYQYRNLGSDGYNSDGIPTVSVSVKAGQTVQFSAGTLPDDYGNYPSGSFTFYAFMGEPDEIQTEEEKITYGVSVTDENRTPISGVKIYLVVEEKIQTITTNAEGVAAVKLPAGDYAATLNVPNGYEARNTEFRLTEKIPTISVKLDTVEVATYTITVRNEKGEAIEGALVSIGDASGRTDASGSAVFQLAKDSYTVSVSASGYAFTSAELAAGQTELTITMKEGAAEGIDYTVNVVDYFGNPMTGVSVTFRQEGTVVGMAEVDASGKAVVQLVPGEYTFTVSDCYVDSAKAVLSEKVPTATITAVAKISGEHTLKQDYDLYHVGTGATYTQLTTTVVNGEDIVDNFFLFLPDRSGTYKFTTTDPSAVISYWSTTTYIYSTIPDSYADNSFTISVKDDLIENGVGFVVGVTGASECVLVITRIGDAEKTIEDYPWSTDWQIGDTPSKPYKASASGTLTYVDITAATSAYTLVYNETDGYYHLNSASGPVVMVRLDLKAPYLSFQDMVDNTGVKRYFYGDSGEFLKKEDYTAYMIACVENMDSTYGTYPLTKDLKYILEGYGASVGWYDIDSKGYIFGSVEVNEEIAWMFACCYFK